MSGAAMDPGIRAVLDDVLATAPAVGEVPVDELRRQRRRLAATASGRLPAGVTVAEVHGAAVRLRSYRSVGARSGAVLLYVHGGGWVMSEELEIYDPVCGLLCAASGCTVLSVGYRLAPEHRFPAALDDVVSVVHRIRAGALGAVPTRLGLAGESSGGNLAAAAALRLRDEDSAALSAQLLLYPVLDARRDTPSYAEFAEGYSLTARQMAWFWDAYLGPGAPRDDPGVSPARAPDLSGLPPAYVVSADYDVLRDEAERYAIRLEAAGVPVRAVRAQGLFHGFAAFAGRLPAAHDAVRRAARWAGDLLGSQVP